jgi:hypothetical protein
MPVTFRKRERERERERKRERERESCGQDERRSGVLSARQWCCHRIPSQNLIAAIGVWFRLPCSQPELVPKSLSARSSQLPLRSVARFPHAARHMPGCSTLRRHSPKLQETSSKRKKAIPGKTDSISSEHRTRIPVIDIGGEPDGHVVPRCFQSGPAFIAPRKKAGGGAGRDGSEPFELR